MAKEPKLTKRELTGPDKFQAKSQSYLDWAHRHPKEILLAGVVLLAVILVIGLVFGGKPSAYRPTKSGMQLSEALGLVDRPVVAPGTEAPTPGTATFASEDEKQRAIETALVALREEHPTSDAARTALLPLADARFQLGRFDEALKGYDEYLAAAPKNDPMRFLALEGRATTLEAKGDLTAAAQAWDRMQQETPAFADRALFGKGRLLEQQGKWDEARKTYEQIRTEYAQSSVMRLASERLAAINVQHPPAAGEADAAEAG